MQTAYQLVWLAKERTPNQIALVDDQTDRKLTYAELIKEVDIVAAGLHERGIGQGDRVATILPSLFDHCVTILALQRIAAVPAMINFRLTPKEIVEILSDGGMKGVISLPDPTVTNAVRECLPDNGLILTVGEAVDKSEALSVCRGEIASLPCPIVTPDDPAFIFYTSGTTGLPKGVILNHGSSEPRVIWLSTQAGLRHGTHNRALGFMPLSHVIGFYGVFLVTLALNGTYYVMSTFDPVKAVDAVEKHRITFMFAVPQLYFAMAQAPNYSPAKVQSTELLLYGGAAIDSEFLSQMDQEWAGTIRHIYGTTETMCSMYNPNPVGNHRRLRPGFYTRMRVIRIDGGIEDLVSPGEEGELIVDVNQDTIFAEYLNRPDATAAKVRDGWYFTGDVCLLHSDGDVDLIGRTDDMIRSGGENVEPSEIEVILNGHSGVKEAVVIGVPDKKWGEVVTACVVGDALLPDDLDKYIKASALAPFKRPRRYLFIDRIPRNAANKVLRRELQSLAKKSVLIKV